jgi:hypothetical protein
MQKERFVNTVRQSRSRSRRVQLLIVAGTLAGIVGYNALKPVPASRISQRPYAPARLDAWEKVTPRLHAADQAGQDAARRYRERVQAFFAERKQNTRDFGEAVLSLGGKWAFVKSKLPFTDVDGHRQFLRERFERIVLSGPELQELIQSVVAGYIGELQGIENDLLVQIRADLSDSDLARFETAAMLRTDEAFRKEYARSLNEVAAVVGRDVMVQIGRETVTWVGADIATNITLSLATALAERLGVSAGMLGSGAASGAATVGIGLAAGLILDALLERILRTCGHDPAGDIGGKVDEALDVFQGLLLDGDPQAVRTYETLRRLQVRDRFSFVREECRQAADRMETGGYLGLDRELKRLKEARSRLRGEALRRLILEGGQS